MAYITKEEVSKKRTEMKKWFPTKKGWKFSITGGNSNQLQITMLVFPEGYNFPEQGQINPSWYRDDQHIQKSGYSEKELKVMDKIVEIAMDGHWDKSDIQSDYFHCAYYTSLKIGKWNKPAQKFKSK